MMGAMAFAQLIAVICFIPLILWLQPAPSFRLASMLYIVGIVGLALIYQLRPPNVMLLLFVPVLIAGFGRGGLNFIPWNIYNYIADVDEIVTGQRREGVFSGVMIFTRKTTMAAAVPRAAMATVSMAPRTSRAMRWARVWARNPRAAAATISAT